MAKNKRWSVELSSAVTAEATLEVDAKTEEEAEEKALADLKYAAWDIVSTPTIRNTDVVSARLV
jgi:hypothetical protein